MKELLHEFFTQLHLVGDDTWRSIFEGSASVCGTLTFVLFTKPDTVGEWLRLFFIGLFVSVFMYPLFMKWLSIESIEATIVARFSGGFTGYWMIRIFTAWAAKKEKDPPENILPPNV